MLIPKRPSGLTQNSAGSAMRANAARFAAESDEIAPVIPTTNNKVQPTAAPPEPGRSSAMALPPAPPALPKPSLSPTVGSNTAAFKPAPPPTSGGGTPSWAGNGLASAGFGAPTTGSNTRGTGAGPGGSVAVTGAGAAGGLAGWGPGNERPGNISPVNGRLTGAINAASGIDSRNPDQMFEDAYKDLLSGDYSTTDQEALIKELMGQQAGQASADLDARMGAAGFGTSGALAAGDANIRADAARGAASDIFNVREKMQDQKRNDLLAGGTLLSQDRNYNMTQDQWNRIMEAMAAGNGDIVDANGDGKDDKTGQTQAELEAHNQTEATAQNNGGAGSQSDPFRMPWGSAQTMITSLGLVPTGTAGYYKDATGKYYHTTERV